MSFRSVATPVGVPYALNFKKIFDRRFNGSISRVALVLTIVATVQDFGPGIQEGFNSAVSIGSLFQERRSL